MPSIEIPAQQITVSSAVGSTLTLTSTANVYAGVTGNLIKSNGTGNIKVQVVSVSSATVCRVRLLPESGGVVANDTALDLSTYNAGKFYIAKQVAYKIAVEAFPELAQVGKVPTLWENGLFPNEDEVPNHTEMWADFTFDNTKGLV